MGDWVMFKGLRVKRSDVGKVLKHLDKLRQETSRIRMRLVPLKMEGMVLSDLGLKNPYQELIDAFERLIATNEKEMEDLRKALQTALQSYSSNEHEV
jgi:flagellar biosynthesis chaperone FliJ